MRFIFTGTFLMLLLPSCATEASTALEVDDECRADDGQCALHALQMRGDATDSDEDLDDTFEFEDDEVFNEGEDLDEEEGVGNCVIGYHQTDPRRGKSIERHGFDVRYAGRSSYIPNIAGQGTYFSTSIGMTANKAHHHGYCFKVQVCLGRSKKLPRWPRGCCSYRQLKSMGYDSATIERGGFKYREYVVYRNDQMKVLDSWACRPDGSRLH
eukprot:TRINITY_DN1448_c0_g1_i5.p1 TRINITY_DN1448_c0_g1~~TRINITY_DN1448_c0_g1_i5.p1  ORF type:complete len:212 (+),score=47.03 TRINITY_DN1448_c0_g1_i5:107-742(+)